MEINEYMDLVNEIADGYFSEDEYTPSIGRMNTLAIYADKFTDIKMGESASEYINEVAKNADIMARFNEEIESKDFFSFGRAVADALEIVNMKKQKIANRNEFTDLIHTIDGKVKELSKIINEDDLMKILSYLNSMQDELPQNNVIKEEAE